MDLSGFMKKNFIFHKFFVSTKTGKVNSQTTAMMWHMNKLLLISVFVDNANEEISHQSSLVLKNVHYNYYNQNRNW